jgi:hypothetical protein
MPERAIEHSKHWLDVISIGGVVATITGYLPAVAATLSIVWTSIRIYETKTVQGWVKRRRK